MKIKYKNYFMSVDGVIYTKLKDVADRLNITNQLLMYHLIKNNYNYVDTIGGQKVIIREQK